LSLAQKLNLKKRGDSLIYWYFTKLQDFSISEMEEVYCDGGGDLGIDSIWIDDDDLVHFMLVRLPPKSPHI
jgi:hypothetical protein